MVFKLWIKTTLHFNKLKGVIIMKKTIALLICTLMCLCFCFAACEKQPSQEPTETKSSETSRTSESASSSVDDTDPKYISESFLKTYFEEPTIITMTSENALISKEKRLYFADKTVEFLTALTDDYDAAIDSTRVDDEQREFRRGTFENGNIIAITQISVIEGKIYNMTTDFTLIAYVFFDDQEHKNEIYVGFSKANNDEYIICELSSD